MGNPDPNCLFCKIVAGDVAATVLERTERVVAFRDIDPKAPTHVLVVPVDHYRDAGEAAAADPALIGDLVATAARIADTEGVNTGGYRMVFNTGAGAGQSVFHTHLHLLGGRPFGWPPG